MLLSGMIKNRINGMILFSQQHGFDNVVMK